MGKITDVFISYSRKDKDFVIPLEEVIRTHGRERDTWIDWNDIPPTADWLAEIYDAIESAKSFLIVISPNSLVSEICNLEIAHAIKHQKQIIPVIFRDIVERDLAGEWFGKDWEQTARDNWSYLKHLNWIFFRVSYTEQELQAYRERHPDPSDGAPPHDDYDAAVAVVLEAVELDLEHKQFHAWLTLSAQAWDRGGRKSASLLRGENADNAWEWLINSEDKQPSPTELQRSYITRSVDRQRQEERERQAQQQREISLQKRVNRLWRYLGSGLAILLCAVLILLLLTNRARQAEKRAKAEVIQERDKTAIERDRALTNESNTLAVLALQQLTVDPVASLSLSLQALPGSSNERPYVPQAELALNKALQASLERAYLDIGAPISIQAIAFEETARVMALGGESLQIVSYDLADSKVLRSNGDSPIRGVEWSDSGILLSYDETIVQAWYAGVPVEQAFDDEITCASWRPGSRAIAVCSGSAVWVWTTQAGQQPRSLGTFAGRLRGIRWSPDGRWLVAWDQGTQSSKIVLWDLENDQQVLQEEQRDAFVSNIVWSPDARHFLSWAAQIPAAQNTVAHEVVVWNVNGLHEPVSLRGHTDKIAGAKFLDDDRLLTWSSDRTARLWGIDGTLLQTYNHPNNDYADDEPSPSISGAEFSPDGQFLLTLMDNGLVNIWDVETGSQITVLRGHGAKIRAVAWQGDYIATASADHTARIWDMMTGQELITLYGHTDEVLDVRWVDRQHLLTSGWDGTLRLWQVFDDNGLPLCSGRDVRGDPQCRGQSRSLVGHAAPIEAAHWLDTTTVTTVDNEGQLMRWSLVTGKGTQISGDREVGKTIITDDGHHFLSFDYGAPGRVHDGETGDVLYEINEPIEDAFWLDPYWLITSATGNALLIHGEGGQDAVRLQNLNEPVRDARLSPDDQVVALIADSGIAGMWDAQTGQQIAEIPTDNRMALTLAWSGDGRRLLIVGTKAVLWDVETLETVWTSDAGEFPDYAVVAFSPLDTYVAVAVTDWVSNSLYVWHVDSNVRVVETGDVDTYIQGLEWDATGTRLLTWGSQETAGYIRVWDINTRETVLQFSSPTPIEVAAFSPDGSQIVTGDDRGLVLVWQTAATYSALAATARDCCITRDTTINDSDGR